MSEKQNPKGLTDKEQRIAVDRGELAICSICGVMTGIEDLKDGKCTCGEVPLISGGPLPEVELKRADDMMSDSDEFVNRVMGRIEGNIAQAEGKLPEIAPIKYGEAVPRAAREVDTKPLGKLGTAINGLREALGQTQEEFAKTLGVHRNTIINLETGRSDQMYMKTRLKFIAVAREAGLDRLAQKFRK